VSFDEDLSFATDALNDLVGMASGHRAPPEANGEGANESTVALLIGMFGATLVDSLDDGTYTMRRPGKTEGHSGTVGKVAPGRFLCFSTHWPPFSTERAYTYHDLLGMLGKRPTVTVPPADHKPTPATFVPISDVGASGGCGTASSPSASSNS
jgi:hypothetical protein